MFLAPKIAGGNTGATANIVTLFREGVGACQAQLWPSYGESWDMQSGLSSSIVGLVHGKYCPYRAHHRRLTRDRSWNRGRARSPRMGERDQLCKGPGSRSGVPETLREGCAGRANVCGASLDNLLAKGRECLRFACRSTARSAAHRP